MGPSAACISVSVALMVQALLFGDGGILSFGANCFNMAFVLPFVGYYVYKFIKERFASKGGETAATILGSYFGIVVASLCAAVEFGIQPLLFTDAAGQALYCPYGLGVSIPAMPGGTVDILLKSEEDEVILTVEDTGIGIPDEDLPHIFTRFYRVDKARSTDAGGSGLGLSIAHDAVKLHGGDIAVEKCAEGGTRFIVRLPACPAAPEEGGPEACLKSSRRFCRYAISRFTSWCPVAKQSGHGRRKRR